jgi:hypothetical protein
MLKADLKRMRNSLVSGFLNARAMLPGGKAKQNSGHDDCAGHDPLKTADCQQPPGFHSLSS